MPNVDAPFGFRAVRHLTGGMHNRTTRYEIASAYGTSIFKGDPVVPTATSKQINRPSADTDRLQGVFQGCSYLNAQGAPQFSNYWPASTVLKTGSVCDALVYDDPNILFEVQADGTWAASDIGALADLVRGTGNTSTGISTDQVDTFSGSGQVFKVHDYSRKANNSAGTDAVLLVSIMKHYLGPSMTAI